MGRKEKGVTTTTAANTCTTNKQTRAKRTARNAPTAENCSDAKHLNNDPKTVSDLIFLYNN